MPVYWDLPVTPLTLFVALLCSSKEDGFEYLSVDWCDESAVKTKAADYKKARAPGPNVSSLAGPPANQADPGAPTGSSASGGGGGSGVTSRPLPEGHSCAVSPTSIRVSALPNTSLTYAADHHSLHGLTYDNLASFKWNKDDGDRPLTPSDAQFAPYEFASKTNPIDALASAKHTLGGSGGAETTPRPISAPGNVVHGALLLVSHIGHGRLWDAYRAIYRNLEANTDHPVVAKVARLDTFDDPNLSDSSGGYSSADEAEDAVHTEAAVYSGPLSKLQRHAVPGYLGLFEGCSRSGPPVRYWLMLMEDAGFRVDGFEYLDAGQR